LPLWQATGDSAGGLMAKMVKRRLFEERLIESGIALSGEAGKRTTRSVTVNIAESPLGWLLSRGLVSQRQFDAGERLRADWERAQLPPRVTMAGIRRRSRPGEGAPRRSRT
jgi:hypothetical protein